MNRPPVDHPAGPYDPTVDPKVVTLAGKPADTTEIPNYDVGLVEMLETTIKEVKQGKVNSVAVVTARYADEDTQHKDYMQIDTSWQGKRLLLLAGACRLLHRLNIDQDEFG